MREKWTDKLLDKIVTLLMTACLGGIGWLINTEISMKQDVALIKQDVIHVKEDVAYLKTDTTEKAIAFQNWRDRVDQTLMIWGAKTYKEPAGPYTERKWKPE